MKNRLFAITGVLISINLFSQQTTWLPHDSNLEAVWGVRFISVVDTNNIWGIGFPQNNYNKASNKFTQTRNQLAHRSLFISWEFEESSYDEILERYVDWKESCDFTKAGKEIFTFTLDDLKKFTTTSEFLVMCIAIGLNNMHRLTAKNNGT